MSDLLRSRNSAVCRVKRAIRPCSRINNMQLFTDQKT